MVLLTSTEILRQNNTFFRITLARDKAPEHDMSDVGSKGMLYLFRKKYNSNEFTLIMINPASWNINSVQIDKSKEGS